MPFDEDPFDGMGKFMAGMGALAVIMNLVLWGGLVAIVLVGLNIAGVI